MQKDQCDNIHRDDVYSVITPKQLKIEFPLTYIEQQNIVNFQNVIINIINKRDPRLLIICGPCSINDIHAAIDYANRLKKLFVELQDRLYIIMRVYLEKPRTVTGWKGLINDPHMNESYDIESGLKIARSLLLKLIKIGIPIATEILNPYIPQYIGECFSWSAIGARTIESQIHREVASGLCMPVGFKNSTDGNIINALNAIHAAMRSHTYVSIDQSGFVSVLSTKGNINTHIILRGGYNPNYYPESIISCEQKIMEMGLPLALMIDCSHGNSKKDYRRQVEVAQSVLHQIKYGNRSIIGLMIESYIYSGNQNLDLSSSKLQYGISITDACIDWKTTENLLYHLYKELKSSLIDRLQGLQ